MKYLKLFEGFYIESIDNIYYEIDARTFYSEVMDRDPVSFSTKEEILIRRIFDPVMYKMYNGVRGSLIFEGIDDNISIYKVNDEWFYVVIEQDPAADYIEIPDSYYKCDQFDGLIELLTKLINDRT